MGPFPTVGMQALRVVVRELEVGGEVLVVAVSVVAERIVGFVGIVGTEVAYLVVTMDFVR